MSDYSTYLCSFRKNEMSNHVHLLVIRDYLKEKTLTGNTGSNFEDSEDYL